MAIKSSRQSIVCERPRHEAAPVTEISLQRILLHQETEIRLAAFNGNASAISVLKKLKVQNGTQAAVFHILNSEFLDCLTPGKPAQLPCGVDHNGALDVIDDES